MITIEVNMKIYHLFIIFFWAILPNVICALEFVAITELDYKLSCSDVPAAISRYMEDNSLDKSQMLELLNKNLHEQLSATDWDEGSKIKRLRAHFSSWQVWERVKHYPTC